MNRSAYYEKMRALAQEVRSQHGLTSYRVMRSDMRRIYRSEGIQIDLWPHRMRNLRGAYFYDEAGASVMVAKDLPTDPLIFTLGHELKHHLVDRALGVSFCHGSNELEPIEIGAEIFAAELIFPYADFQRLLEGQGIGPLQCRPEDLVRLKHETETTLSYAGLAKRAIFTGFATTETMNKVSWKKIEAAMYGEPLYKIIQRNRRSS